MEALFHGKFPKHRHDGTNFRPGMDTGRLAVAGTTLKFRGILLALKADWGEFSGTLGFPSCASKLNPCFFCCASQENWHSCEGLSPLQTPFPLKTFAQYEACSRCEVHRVLGGEAFALVKASLEFDRRKQGSHGRALRHDIPSLGLLKGDRLEPSVHVPDTGGGFDSLVPPIRATFWRPSEESMTRHRNPLWCSAIGLTPQACIQVDWMHTLSLGIFQDFVGSLCQALFAANALGVSGSPDVRKQVSVQYMERELFDFYAEAARTGTELSRVQRLDPGMFGDAGAPTCRLHAGETNGLLASSQKLVERFHHKLPNGLVWKAAAGDMQKLKALCDLPPQVFKPVHSQAGAGRQWGGRFFDQPSKLNKPRAPISATSVFCLPR